MLEVQPFSTTYLSCLSTIFLIYNYAYAKSEGQQDAAHHLNLGNSFLSKGQFAEALQHYHSAVDLDPNNYQALYRRATVLLATGKMKAALPDLNRVVELKPDFIAGRMQRGNILLKQGKLSEATSDFRYCSNRDGEHQSEANEKLQLIVRLQEWVEQAADYLENDNYGSAETLLDRAIEHCNWNPDLHRKRSKCRLARNDVHNAIADIRALANLVPDSTEAFLEMSRMYYEIGDVENSLIQIRECLKLNPDHKECFPFYKKIKKLAKMRESLQQLVAQEKWMDCLDKAQQILKTERNIESIQLDVFRYSCKCNLKLDHIAEAIQECSEVLTNVNENDLDALLNRGDAYLASEEYDKAIEDFQKAVNEHGDSRRAKEALERARKTQKMAQKKDYYKILGLRRNASKKDVTRAYRKLAQQWHPDNFQDSAEKEKAQAKFIDIARAKEVLSDPEKRRIYDAGEDPLDPQGGHHSHGGHHQWQQHWGDMPFGQGFPFGGGQQGGSGGYTFKFHFG